MSVASDLTDIAQALKASWEAVLPLASVKTGWGDKNTANLIRALNSVFGGTWVTGVPAPAVTRPDNDLLLSELEANLSELYLLCKVRRATMPALLNFENLPATIRSIDPNYRVESDYGVVSLGTYIDFAPYRLTANGWASLTARQFITDAEGVVRWAPRPLEYDNGDGVKTVQATYDNLIVVDLPTGETGASYPAFLASSQVRRVTYNSSQPLADVADNYLARSSVFEANLPPLDGIIGDEFMSLCSNLRPWTPMTVKSTASFKSPEPFFLTGVNNFAGEVIVESPNNAPEADVVSLSAVNSSSAPAYRQGITLSGAGAAAWKAALPNGIYTRVEGAYYRNLK